MPLSFRFVRHVCSMWRRKRLLRSSVVSLTAAAVGFRLMAAPEHLKDQVVFLSREENAAPSSVRIPIKPMGENRDPLLPNGELNMACQCIEKDVVGPCNIEFRVLRQFIHDINYTRDNLASNQLEKLDGILEEYIMCTFNNPIYYKEKLIDEEREDEEELQRKIQEKEERKRKKKAANFRDLGKDKVLFLTKEENSIPSTAKIEAIVTEEYRGPVLPNGEVNWACTCIEREVIGPCNPEFRDFRQYIHDNKGDPAKLPIEEQKKLHTIIGRYLGCTQANPLYYRDLLRDNSENGEDADLGDIDRDEVTDSNAQGANGGKRTDNDNMGNVKGNSNTLNE